MTTINKTGKKKEKKAKKSTETLESTGEISSIEKTPQKEVKSDLGIEGVLSTEIGVDNNILGRRNSIFKTKEILIIGLDKNISLKDLEVNLSFLGTIQSVSRLRDGNKDTDVIKVVTFQ